MELGLEAAFRVDVLEGMWLTCNCPHLEAGPYRRHIAELVPTLDQHLRDPKIGEPVLVLFLVVGTLAKGGHPSCKHSSLNVRYLDTSSVLLARQRRAL